MNSSEQSAEKQTAEPQIVELQGEGQGKERLAGQFLVIAAHMAVVAFGVILPVIALGVEAAFHVCGGVFFDPLPSFSNYVFVAAVPIVNMALYVTFWRARVTNLTFLSILGGVAIGVCFVYALAFIPMMPIALPAILFGGIGLLLLSPLLALLCSYGLVVAVTRRATGLQTWVPSRYTIMGVTAAFVCFALAELPGTVTRVAMTQAASEDVAMSRGGIRMLRAFGSETWLLNECYNHPKTMTDIVLGALNAYDWSTQQKARRIYYRVTGRPFNTVPRPKLTGLGWDLRLWSTRDEDVGGDEVGGKINNLSLADSSLNAVVEPEGAVGYEEWTFNFRNDSDTPQEARTQIALPPGAVVSRLTLWVNGKPQEAVFGSREKTKSAYKSVVHRQQDPVLVTTLGPDRVLLQCFPVPANGGTMRTRIGFTVPLSLDDASHARLPLPRLVENNFSIAGRHNVFFQSPTACKATVAGLKLDHPPGKFYQLHGFIDSRQYQQAGAAVIADRSPDVVHASAVYALKGEAPYSYAETLQPKKVNKPGHVTFVVDCGRSMENCMGDIAEALKALPTDITSEVRVASDEISSLTSSSDDGSEHNREFAIRELPRVPCKGGPDNFKELLLAAAPLKEHKDVTVVWVHGPQPVLPDDVWRLQQQLDVCAGGKGTNRLTIYDVEAASGPDRLAEVVLQKSNFINVPRRAGLKEDLQRLFASWTGSDPQLQFVRTPLRSAGASPGNVLYVVADSWLDPSLALKEAVKGKEEGSVVTAPYLSALWAADECARLVAAGRSADASKLATYFRIVTPVSGAVVLDSAEQYKRAELDPNNPDANAMVPTAPEPGEWVLIILATGALLWTARRRKVNSTVTS